MELKNEFDDLWNELRLTLVLVFVMMTSLKVLESMVRYSMND